MKPKTLGELLGKELLPKVNTVADKLIAYNQLLELPLEKVVGRLGLSEDKLVKLLETKIEKYLGFKTSDKDEYTKLAKALSTHAQELIVGKEE